MKIEIIVSAFHSSEMSKYSESRHLGNTDIQRYVFTYRSTLYLLLSVNSRDTRGRLLFYIPSSRLPLLSTLQEMRDLYNVNAANSTPTNRDRINISNFPQKRIPEFFMMTANEERFKHLFSETYYLNIKCQTRNKISRVTNSYFEVYIKY